MIEYDKTKYLQILKGHFRQTMTHKKCCKNTGCT